MALALRAAAPSTSALDADVSNSRIGGSGEIRTHGRDEPSPVFKTGALNRSATLPLVLTPDADSTRGAAHHRNAADHGQRALGFGHEHDGNAVEPTGHGEDADDGSRVVDAVRHRLGRAEISPPRVLLPGARRHHFKRHSLCSESSFWD